MATGNEYALLAAAVYSNKVKPYPDGNQVQNWDCQHWESGTFFGNGLQGGVYQNDHEVIVAFKGTDPGSRTAGQDLVADLKLGLNCIPKQGKGAINLVKIGKGIANGRRVTVCGHSLGGALAQVSGVTEAVRFVAFNAPGAAKHLKLVAAAERGGALAGKGDVDAEAPAGIISGLEQYGFYFKIDGDPVSLIGSPVGKVIIFNYANAARAADEGKHSMKTCVLAMDTTDYAKMHLFGDPSPGSTTTASSSTASAVILTSVLDTSTPPS